jgi:hypothetical protein
MNNPHGLVLAKEGGTRNKVIFLEKIIAEEREPSEDEIFSSRMRGWVAECERWVRKFSKATNTNEETLSQEGKGVFILKSPGHMAITKRLSPMGNH